MITAVTPTGDRLHQFEICYELMMRQTIKPDRWFIIDDGVGKMGSVVSGKINNMEIIIIKREPNPDKMTLKDNLLAVLDKININDKMIFFEDDDFYPDTYLEVMSQLLDSYLVVGGLLRKYYNLKFKGYREFTNPVYGTLNSSALNVNEKTLDSLREVCNNGDGTRIDLRFWSKIKSEGVSSFLHSDERAQVIGVKGWNVGRKGAIVATHTRNRQKFAYDKDYNILKYCFGDFSEKYKFFITHGFLIDLWRAFFGVIFRFRASYKS